METGTPTVLITGATSGIGYEISKLFAREHYNMVVVGQEPATLHNVAEVLKTLGAKSVHALCKNFSFEKAAEEVYHEIQEAGLKLDLLVLNALPGQAGKFTDVPVNKDLEFLHQNIAGPIILCKYFLKEMVASGSGKVLYLLPYSLYDLGYHPALANAAKSFLLSFADSMIKELETSPVEIQALVSGLRNISLYGRNGLSNLPSSVEEADDPAAIARVAFNSLFAGEIKAVTPAPHFAQQIAASGSAA